MTEKAYTTFQIAKICGVKSTTIISWIKKRKMEAYVTPGGHMRVKESDLIAFLKKYGLPIPEPLDTKYTRQ